MSFWDGGVPSRDFSTGAFPPNPENPQVLTIHAELEGGPFLAAFAGLLRRCRRQGVAFCRLMDWAQGLLRTGADSCGPGCQCRLPGRAGTVSCQGRVEARP